MRLTTCPRFPQLKHFRLSPTVVNPSEFGTVVAVVALDGGGGSVVYFGLLSVLVAFVSVPELLRSALLGSSSPPFLCISPWLQSNGFLGLEAPGYLCP